jgi:hypothetical protein
MTKKFCFSSNQETYQGNYDTREEAVMEAIDHEDLAEGSTVWTGELKAIEVKRLIPRASYLIEQMQEAAVEEVGEVVEGWLDHTSKEAADDLRSRVAEAVSAWLDADPSRQIHFWGVEHIQEHTVTAELLAQPKG